MYALNNISRYSYAVFQDALDEHDINLLLDQETSLEDAVLEGKRSDEKTRKSKIKWLQDYEKFNSIYEKVTFILNKANKDFFKYEIDWLEPLQYTVYSSDLEFYGKHMDYGQTPGCRKLSISIQLSDENSYTGGDLKIYNGGEEFVAERKKGTAIIFNSMLVHEVTPVTSGTRRSLVGWAIGPEWK